MKEIVGRPVLLEYDDDVLNRRRAAQMRVRFRASARRFRTERSPRLLRTARTPQRRAPVQSKPTQRTSIDVVTSGVRILRLRAGASSPARVWPLPEIDSLSHMSDPMDPKFTAQNPIVAAATRIRARRELARAVDAATGSVAAAPAGRCRRVLAAFCRECGARDASASTRSWGA